MPPRIASAKLLGFVVGALALLGVFLVLERTLSMAEIRASGAMPAPDSYEWGFARHPLLTLVHILPGLVFMVVGPLQFVPAIRARHLRLHRWCGRLFVASGLLLGITAIAMAIVIGYGGAAETSAVLLFGTIFLYALVKAFVHIRRRQIAQHREWMIRAFAIGLAVATMRPLVATMLLLTDLSFNEILGISFWIGFSVHLLVAEVWINLTRPDAEKSGR